MAERRTSPRRKLVTVLTVVALGLAVTCISLQWTDVVFNPWARSLTGDSVLLGSWKGELRTPGGEARPVEYRVPGGQTRRVSLRLTRSKHTGYKCTGCVSIEGSAVVCRADGPAENYTLRGKPRNWSGTRFYVDAVAPSERAPGTYTTLGLLEGEWDGADLIRFRLTPHPVVINADGSATTSSDSRYPDPEITMELTRTDDANPAC